MCLRASASVREFSGLKMPQLRTAFEVCAGAGSHLEGGFDFTFEVPNSKACFSVCRSIFVPISKFKRG